MRIAHISDLHVLAIAGVPASRFLNKRFTGYMNLRLKRGHKHRSQTVVALLREIRRQAPEHVVITGDLTNLALEPEFEAVKAMLETELGYAPRDVSVIPGNHDVYTRGAFRSHRFATFFAPYITSDIADASGSAVHFPYLRIREHVAIIGLSSAVPRLPFVAAGKLGVPQAAAIREILARDDVKSRTPIFLIHHPLHNPESFMKRTMEGLHDAESLSAITHDLPRALILHGHLHRRIRRDHLTNARVLSIGATSASLHHEHADKMAGFNIYDIAKDGTLAIEAHVYDESTEAFTKAEVPEAIWH